MVLNSHCVNGARCRFPVQHGFFDLFHREFAVIRPHRCWIVTLVTILLSNATYAADARYHSDSDARFLHHIDLYDIDNRKITAESTKPYSPLNTCGRCHDYETISHGWHFNAFLPDSIDGRDGEPWIWTDPKTGTQLPLAYRKWSHTYNPKAIGITSWEMTRHFGGRMPGGNMGQDSEGDAGDDDGGGGDADAAQDGEDAAGSAEDDVVENGEAPPARWELSGPLQIDCMVCHAVSGAYDFNARRDQIAGENFAWAPTAALRLGEIDGTVSRIKEGSDPADEETQEKIPTVTYDPSRFGLDGTIFMDLVREPTSNACYQCHSNRPVGKSGIEPRWIHDEDVHLRAGMVCADCHRNGIDHHIVRGYKDEQHPSGHDVATLSCSGCHLGTGHDGDGVSRDPMTRAGRLGSPKPLHAGLPPVHFEKLSCTACHGGPLPRDEAIRIMTSLAHGLGEKEHRTGSELPAIVAPVYTAGDDGRVYPNKAMWPAFWGTIEDGKIQPIPPSKVYDLTRPALRVRNDFVEELLKPKMSSSDLKEILGEERAAVESDEWTEEERLKVETAQAEEGRTVFEEKVYAALGAIEEDLGVTPAVYVSSGVLYVQGDEEDKLKEANVSDDRATQMITWPMAHNVRPAGWSLGVAGCTECHSDEGRLFTSTVAALGPGPDRGEAVTMASLQGVDPDQRLQWNELFRNRDLFKYIIAGSIAAMLITLFIGIGALASRLAHRTA